MIVKIEHLQQKNQQNEKVANIIRKGIFLGEKENQGKFVRMKKKNMLLNTKYSFVSIFGRRIQGIYYKKFVEWRKKKSTLIGRMKKQIFGKI